MMEQIAEALPQSKASTIGVVYLLSILTAFLGAFLINGLVVPSDAAATANSLLAHETLYRSGFAFYDLLLGYLIFRSTFLPRILGVLLMLAGVGWLTFAWPPLATALFSYLVLLGGLAEILLMPWLLVKGVNVEQWQKRALESARM